MDGSETSNSKTALRRNLTSMRAELTYYLHHHISITDPNRENPGHVSARKPQTVIRHPCDSIPVFLLCSHELRHRSNLSYMFIRQSRSEPGLLSYSSFQPRLPHLVGGKRALAKLVPNLSGVSFAFVLDHHIRLKLRRYTSCCLVEKAHRVQCLCMQEIEVQESHRRQGHARQTIRALRRAAAEAGCVLVIEQVVSEYMHTLVKELDGVVFPPSMPTGIDGKGCNYWLPPSPVPGLHPHWQGVQRAVAVADSEMRITKGRLYLL